MQRISFYGMALAVVLAAPLSAQEYEPSMDVTVGLSDGWGGRHRYQDAVGVFSEVTIGWREPTVQTAWAAAVTIGARATPAGGDVCVLEVGTSSGCAPRFPALVNLGLLGGLERRQWGTTVRALAGPALFAGEGRAGAGGQLQIDVAAGFEHLAFVAAARGNVVVRYDGETLRLGSLGFGFRVR